MVDPPKLKSLPTPPSRTPPPVFDDLITGDALDQLIFPELEYAIPGLIPEGSTILVGPPKAGKSWLVLGLALALASGSPALSSIEIPKPRPVLMLALEDGRRRFQSRCRSILGSGTSIPPLLSVVTKIDPKTLFSDIERWLYEKDDQKPLVVLDTLGKVMPPAVAGESAYQRDYRIGSDIKRLVDNYPGSSFITIHHDRKAGGEDFVDSVSGTHGLAGAADTIILLERERQQNSAVLHVTGRDVTEDEYALLSVGNGVWRLDAPSLEQASMKSTTKGLKQGIGSVSQQIIDYISEASNPVQAKEITDKFGKSARVNLKRLTDAGRIVRPSYNEYAIAVPSRISNCPDVG